MFNRSFPKMLGVALVSVPILLSGGIYSAQAEETQDVEFKLINNTNRTLTHFYISPTASDEWGPDILLDEVIPSREYGTVTIEDGLDTCYYDLRATFGPGDGVGSGDVYQTNVNVCELAEYTYE